MFGACMLHDNVDVQSFTESPLYFFNKKPHLFTIFSFLIINVV